MTPLQFVNIEEDTISPFFNFSFHKHKFILFSIIGISIILIGLYTNKQHNNISNNTSTKYIIQEDEICQDCAYYTYPKNQVKHIIWNGDYNSTFLLCWFFIIKDEPVQPLYIMTENISNNHNINEIKNKQTHEMQIMKKIRQILIEKYPYKKSRLLPTYYIYSIDKNNSITNKFITIHKKLNIFNTDLPNYERITRLSNKWHQPIHISLNNSDNNFNNLLMGNLHNLGYDNCMIAEEKQLQIKQLVILKNIRFPIIHLTDDNMKNISLDSNNYFYDILQLTILD